MLILILSCFRCRHTGSAYWSAFTSACEVEADHVVSSREYMFMHVIT
jgi:hypothetical protein